MLHYVLRACELAGVDRTLVVVGHGKEQVIERFDPTFQITWVEQLQQHGTGHAVLCCKDALADFEGNALVVAGDMPLIRRETLVELLREREESGDAVTLATTFLDDPTGYGRIIRDAQAQLHAIVEDRDCTPPQREVHEVNPSYYCFHARRMFEVLAKVKRSVAKAEYYLTDAVALLKQDGQPVSARVTIPREDATGINSRLDLATVGRMMQDRIQFALMEEGVTIVDPDNTWIEADVEIGRDTVIFPFSAIGAGATIGTGCRIGPFARIGAGELVSDGARVEPGQSATHS
jgi:bifunctional UDP-N-acetylglucosamine pyrophosphorylase/glucosamine-1-phosphate N-acetyltransferase